MEAKGYSKIHLRMCASVKRIETVASGDIAGDLYILHMDVSRSDQQGGKVYAVKMGLQKDFVDSLDRNQKADLVRHEITRRMFDGMSEPK